MKRIIFILHMLTLSIVIQAQNNDTQSSTGIKWGISAKEFLRNNTDSVLENYKMYDESRKIVVQKEFFMEEFEKSYYFTDNQLINIDLEFYSSISWSKKAASQENEDVEKKCLRY